MSIYKIHEVDEQIRFLQLPMALFTNPEYAQLTNDARLLYALLRNRMMLSKENGWVNDKGELFLLCSRDEAGLFLHVSKPTITKAFKLLVDANLIIEKRQGLSKPNVIFVCHPKGVI